MLQKKGVSYLRQILNSIYVRLFSKHHTRLKHIKSWNTPYTSECKTDNFLFTGPSLFCKSIFQLQICNSLLPLYTLFFLKTFVFPDFLSFLCHINSILKKDCLNYREELRDWARWNSDNLRNFPKGAKTRPEHRSYNLKQKKDEKIYPFTWRNWPAQPES